MACESTATSIASGVVAELAHGSLTAISPTEGEARARQVAAADSRGRR